MDSNPWCKESAWSEWIFMGWYKTNGGCQSSCLGCLHQGALVFANVLIWSLPLVLQGVVTWHNIHAGSSWGTILGKKSIDELQWFVLHICTYNSRWKIQPIKSWYRFWWWHSRSEYGCFYILSWISRNDAFVIVIGMYAIGFFS